MDHIDEAAAREARAAHAQSVYTLADAMMRWGLRFSLPLSLVVVGVAMVLEGQPGLVGSGFGVVLGFGCSLITITMMRIGATKPPASLMNLALGGYAIKMSLLLVVMLVLRDIDGLSRPSLAFGMLVVVVSWAVAEVVAFRTTKTPTLIIPRPSRAEQAD
ncbi:hypothetical protein JHE00_15985 [Prauserella sp. ASG 168]|uniref:ATP synthase protein I n=1 Tax=Prauserella cavernicola TaxID=2800127 RepID=A0A934V4W8_9PSEU|nr:hypothetical protein [Prauserella cavernicola]